MSKSKLRKDIIEELKVLYGKEWQSKVRLSKFKAVPFNKRLSIRYERAVIKYSKATTRLFLNELIKNVRNEIRTDAEIPVDTEIGNQLVQQLASLETLQAQEIQELSIAIRDIGREMLSKDNSVFQDTIKNALGFTPDFETDPVFSKLNSWQEQNINLITNIDTQTKTKIDTSVREVFRRGGRSGELAKEFRDIKQFNERRMRLVARDQTAKLHGQITRQQHLSVGVTQYIWKTSADERVRSKHRVLNNTVRNYGEGLEPAVDIQCRCSAEPVIEL